MLKKGFTLQELLISLAVIGVVSAVALPSLMSIQPDKSKTMYMKAYNTLTTLTDEILNDPSLYYTIYNSNGIASCSGINCTEPPLTEQFEKAFDIDAWKSMGGSNDEDTNKFGLCLASKMNIVETFGPNLIDHTTNAAGEVKFTTTDGISWKYIGDGLKGNDVIINIKPTDHSKNNPCSYSTTCLKPNEFKFRIDNDGGIRPADALGMAYLQNPTDTRSGATDRRLAAQIVEEAQSATDIDAMSTVLTKIVGKTCPTTNTTTNTTNTNPE